MLLHKITFLLVALLLLQFTKANTACRSYNVTVATSSSSFSGTDSDVYLTIYGSKNNTGEIYLNDLMKGNPFETGAVDVTDILGTDVGTIASVKVRKINCGFDYDWHLRSISIDSKDAVFDRWIDSGSYTAAVSGDYHVQIKTGNVGTNANISLTIYGGEGNSGKQYLSDMMPPGVMLEENSLVDLTLSGIKDIGPTERVEIINNGELWHWNKGNATWSLDWITVNGEKANFGRLINEGETASEKIDTTQPSVCGTRGNGTNLTRFMVGGFALILVSAAVITVKYEMCRSKAHFPLQQDVTSATATYDSANIVIPLPVATPIIPTIQDTVVVMPPPTAPKV